MPLAQAYAAVANSKQAKPETEKRSPAWLEKARASLAQGAEKFPGELQFTISHGSVCHMLKEPDDGEKLWKSDPARDQWKNNPQAIDAFADFYRAARKPDDAEKVLPRFPGDSRRQRQSGHHFSSVRSARFPEANLTTRWRSPTPCRTTRSFGLQKIDLLVNQGKLADAEKLISRR